MGFYFFLRGDCKYLDKFFFFDLVFENNDPELAEEFTKFFYVKNLSPLFTNEHKAASIKVSWVDAKSVVGEGKKANRLLQTLSNLLSVGQDNKKYEEAVFKILHQSRTFPGFIKNVEQHIEYMYSILPNYVHNSWNIVFYDKDKTGTKVSRGL